MRFTTYRGEHSLEDLVKRVFRFSGSEKPELLNAAKDALLEANPQLWEFQSLPAATLLAVPEVPGFDSPPSISQVPLDALGITNIREGLTGLKAFLSQVAEERQSEMDHRIRALEDPELRKILNDNSEVNQLTSRIAESIEEAKTTKTEIDNDLKIWRDDIASLLKNN